MRAADRVGLGPMGFHCNRRLPDDAAVEREFNLVHTEWQFPASFNVAPTQNVPVIRGVDGTPRLKHPMGPDSVLRDG